MYLQIICHLKVLRTNIHIQHRVTPVQTSTCFFCLFVCPWLQEVKIPGKKMFGFTSETRLFVSSVEEGSTAADLLAPGDEITQVCILIKYMYDAWSFAMHLLHVCML